MNTTFGDLLVGFFYLAECPVSTVSKILKEEEMRMLLSLLTAKAAPRRIIFERRVTYIQFQFPLSVYFYCMAYGT